ncbi:MAG: DUF1080 domain-containing protein [Verrucomicrobia bacterium]|nr:DUF1080 domain-containing protein [Verrucomicrobiota bacterium]MDA1068295.1 DUF1080 domain-containing protein [Verrucomicrobiota bacterium]
MKNYPLKLTLLVLCCAVSSLFAKSHASNDGWKSLFDGKTMKGWAVVQGFANYYVEDGAILGRTAEGSPNTFLHTYDNFGDFELKFECKVDVGLNSGVMIRSNTRNFGTRRYFGPQIEIETSPGQSGWVYGEGLNTGWISEEPMSKDKSVNEHSYVKNDGWNEFHIIAKGDTITTFINGNQVTKMKLPRTIHNENPSGSIGLQVHGIKEGSGPYEVRWRNIMIKEL